MQLRMRACSPALALALSLAAACSSGPSRPDGGPICGQADSGPCAAGTLCTNGDCRPACDANGGCAAGDYCESDAGSLDVCSPVVSTPCTTDTDCPEPQACSAGGLCFSTEERANGRPGCDLSTPSDDGCTPDALCYQVASGSVYLNQCVGLQHCGEDLTCPVGASGSGAVCNELPDGGQIFAGKERLCLYGFCLSQTNCPSDTVCFRADPAAQIGQCQLGEYPDQCFTNDDCPAATTGCELVDGGGIDDGGVLGVCY